MSLSVSPADVNAAPVAAAALQTTFDYAPVFTQHWTYSDTFVAWMSVKRDDVGEFTIVAELGFRIL